MVNKVDSSFGEDNSIIIRGARQHNLKNIDLSLPRNKFIVFTGVSGSCLLYTSDAADED